MKLNKKLDIIRNAPLYNPTEASKYLSIPVSTLRYWAIGESREKRTVNPLINTPNKSNQLSFLNLVELHVLGSIRNNYNVDIVKVRKSLNYLKRELGSSRPLLDQSFETDGVDLFIDHYGKLINVTSSGQAAMREILKGSLTRIARDKENIPFKLFPYTHSNHLSSPSVISMSPQIFSGRPVIEGTGISTAIIAERYKAGDGFNELAEDYSLSIEKIEEAMRCELQLAA